MSSRAPDQIGDSEYEKVQSGTIGMARCGKMVILGVTQACLIGLAKIILSVPSKQ